MSFQSSLEISIDQRFITERSSQNYHHIKHSTIPYQEEVFHSFRVVPIIVDFNDELRKSYSIQSADDSLDELSSEIRKIQLFHNRINIPQHYREIQIVSTSPALPKVPFFFVLLAKFLVQILYTFGGRCRVEPRPDFGVCSKAACWSRC